MNKPETTVEHLSLAMHALTQAMYFGGDRDALVSAAHEHLAAIWSAEVLCSCHARSKSRHLVSCPVRHAFRSFETIANHVA
jgi:hypothetical protein